MGDLLSGAQILVGSAASASVKIEAFSAAFEVMQPAIQQIASLDEKKLQAAWGLGLSVLHSWSPLRLLGSCTAVVGIGRVVHGYLIKNEQTEQVEKMSKEIEELKEENRKLYQQNKEIVDTMMARFQVIVEQQNQEHEKLMQEVVQYYEGQREQIKEIEDARSESHLSMY